MITAERLREVVTYDPETGIFRWTSAVSSTKVRAGDVAGYVCSTLGYVMMGVDGASYRAHRLAWLYVHRRWPSNQIDHINGAKDDNRLANLREATAQQNVANRGRHKNNQSGFKGVVWHRGAKRWRAYINADRKFHHIGYFDSAEEAHAAYVDVAERTFGAFARAA